MHLFPRLPGFDALSVHHTVIVLRVLLLLLSPIPVHLLLQLLLDPCLLSRQPLPPCNLHMQAGLALGPGLYASGRQKYKEWKNVAYPFMKGNVIVLCLVTIGQLPAMPEFSEAVMKNLPANGRQRWKPMT